MWRPCFPETHWQRWQQGHTSVMNGLKWATRPCQEVIHLTKKFQQQTWSRLLPCDWNTPHSMVTLLRLVVLSRGLQFWGVGSHFNLCFWGWYKGETFEPKTANSEWTNNTTMIALCISAAILPINRLLSSNGNSANRLTSPGPSSIFMVAGL